MSIVFGDLPELKIDKWYYLAVTREAETETVRICDGATETVIIREGQKRGE